MKKNVRSVSKLKRDASQSIFPPVIRTIAPIAIPVMRTVTNGTLWRDIKARRDGRTPCRAMAKSARDAPMIEDMITDVVAKRADIAMNSISIRAL